ncbi:MAG TPA: hypothetical protein ENK23_04080, partial [Sorangium sp.]|nr:hypothetical protein [Sorangium sp.]
RRGFAVGSGDDRSRYAPRPHDVKAAPLFDKLFPAPVVPHHGDTPIGPAVALERVVLLERATPNARATATLEKGEVVMAVKQSGEWLLVVVNEQGHTRFGWAHREQLRTMAPTMDGRR